ncbi:facilitated trehalose transporter Tret1 isoform X2 [Leptinotarsa decemlineata]|uniref:facilitated trehalose transporter Tret1 isoform X2 n=1 Tax=Leptinotarsa decemlineata TaxID=7539 RepID=UPI000C253CCA|nr:facilitated trehalose transporter Tret1-like isoform X1 [Leptinotarsa decemlineata]XP_023023949.1 facilitated trehalose transporter Tret1-like isoform X1 [Leptinotarsa decemlineata]
MQNRDGSLFSGTKSQLLAAVSGSLFAVSDGMSYGWTAPVIPYLIGQKSHIVTTKYEAEWLESCLMIGSFMGLPFTIYFVDKIGRKKSLLVAALISLLSWLMILLANKMWHMFIARFLFGVTANTSFVAAPIYIAEIADHNIRGFLSSVIYLSMLVGLLLVYSIGPFCSFYIPPAIGITVLAIELITFPFVPESPYYLLFKGDKENGQKSLHFFRPNKDITNELEDITKAVERQKNETARIQDLILVKSNRKAITIMAVLDAGQHFCAISVILMNLHLILDAAGSIYVDSSIAAVIFAVIMLVVACVASLQVDRYGRKALIIGSTILTGVFLLTLAVYFHLKLIGYNLENVSWIPIVVIMFYAASFKLGIGIVPVILTAELFSTKMKALGMTIADLMYVFGAIISLQLYQWLSNSYGMHIPFYLFGSSSFFVTFFTIWYIPETKGKTLEEIQFILKEENIEVPPSLSRIVPKKSYNTFSNEVVIL